MNDEPRDGGLIDKWLILQIIFIIVCFTVGYIIVDKLIKPMPSFTIQDVENWCCRNNKTISPTGENCLDLNAIVCPGHNREILKKYME